MTFGAANDHPTKWQGARVIDHTDDQGNATAPNHTPIHHQLDRLACQCDQHLLGDGQKGAIDRLAVVFEPTAKAVDHTLLLGASTGRMVGDRGEVGNECSVRQSNEG